MFQILCSSGKSWKLGVPFQLYRTVLKVGFKGRACSAFPIGLDVGIFSSTQYVEVTQLISGFLSALYVDVHLGHSWEE